MRQQRLDAVDDSDDVGARLALNIHDHRGSEVHPRGLLGVFGAVGDGGNIRKPHRRAILVGNDQRAVLVARRSADRWRRWCRTGAARPACLWPDRRWLPERGAQVFQAQAIRGQRGRVGLNAHRRLLSAADGNQTHAGELRNFLRQGGVGQILDLRKRQRVGGRAPA